MLPTPGFHHLHLNSVDPDAAIAFYVSQFPSTSKGSWAGLPALLSPNNVMILFNTVERPPAMSPPSAIWHFGWHVPDVRKNIETFKARPEVKLLPLYTTDEGGHVLINSDTWPAPKGGAPGLTRAQIAEAKAKKCTARGRRRFRLHGGTRGRAGRVSSAIIRRNGSIMCISGRRIRLAALEWYQVHLNAPVPPGFTPPEQRVKRGTGTILAGIEPGRHVP